MWAGSWPSAPPSSFLTLLLSPSGCILTIEKKISTVRAAEQHRVMVITVWRREDSCCGTGKGKVLAFGKLVANCTP